MREQLILDLRQIQNQERQKFGDMATAVFGQAADQLERDGEHIDGLEYQIANLRRQTERNYGCLLLAFIIIQVASWVTFFLLMYFSHRLF